jgi:hypothetical protein
VTGLGGVFRDREQGPLCSPGVVVAPPTGSHRAGAVCRLSGLLDRRAMLGSDRDVRANELDTTAGMSHHGH